MPRQPIPLITALHSLSAFTHCIRGLGQEIQQLAHSSPSAQGSGLARLSRSVGEGSLQRTAYSVQPTAYSLQPTEQIRESFHHPPPSMHGCERRACYLTDLQPTPYTAPYLTSVRDNETTGQRADDQATRPTPHAHTEEDGGQKMEYGNSYTVALRLSPCRCYGLGAKTTATLRMVHRLIIDFPIHQARRRWDDAQGGSTIGRSDSTSTRTYTYS